MYFVLALYSENRSHYIIFFQKISNFCPHFTFFISLFLNKKRYLMETFFKKYSNKGGIFSISSAMQSA